MTDAAVSETTREPPATVDLSSDACFIDLRKSKRKKNEEKEEDAKKKKEKKEERRHLPEDETKQLVTSYVFSRLDYCNSLLMGTPQSVIQQMQKVQNTAACLILRASTTTSKLYISPTATPLAPNF